MEAIPDRARHGPADAAFPPPGDGLKAVTLSGRLVGWADQDGLDAAKKCGEMGEQIAAEHHAHLVGRLGHKLRSAVLTLQETARQAAYGRPELLETVFDQSQEVGRRAAALEAAAVEPKDSARGVVLGAVLNLALPGSARSLPPRAVVVGSEPALVEAFTRARDWMGGDGVEVSAEPVGDSWWKVSIATTGTRKALAVPEMGEPLVRLIVDIHLGGWLDASRPDRADLYLPAHPTG